jgi:4-amino-4-deoxy-L-arabinose transferase-like glycosyltransferase
LQSIIGPITYLLVGVMAAWPRLLNLDQFLTVDEANFWIARSERFLNAMRAGDWLATAISTHPGVMTMWSGALGILIRRPLLEAGILSSLSVAEAIGLMRLPMALIHTCAVLIGYGLLRRMLSPLAAFLAAIFWALDPFVVAYSRLLHVDAPLTSLSPAERRLVALLAVWVLLLTVALSIFPKKFNRYILPVFPLLDVLAALGIARIAQLLIDRTRAQLVGVLSAGIGVALATVACFNMLGWHPYGIAAFNQALGGAQAGREVFAVGWGEGFELVAAWLNQRPDITGVSTVSRIPVVQNPYMRERANAETPKGGVLPDAAGYLVVYVSQIQRSDPSPPFTDFYLQEQPLHVVQIEGVDYAWIYQVPPRSAVATPA